MLSLKIKEIDLGNRWRISVIVGWLGLLFNSYMFFDDVVW